MSNEAVWFIFSQEQQLGPFTKAQLYQQFQKNKFPPDVHLFREGWKEWLPLNDCASELGLPFDLSGNTVSLQDRRRKGSRVGIAGQIIVHNQGDLAIGSGVNLSGTGLFVETTQQIFRVGETLILTCKVKQMPTPFHAKAEVIRFNAGNNDPTGFGLRWTEISDAIQQDIQKLTNASKSEGTSLQGLPPLPTGNKKIM